ncbi:MAG: hypothetical protein V4622_01855 [Bacteroidota bacterium]
MNNFLLAVLISLLFGLMNGFYWSKQGYKGWHIYFIGTIAFFGLYSMILKFMK